MCGYFKLYISFAKEPYKRDYILQKRPLILHMTLRGEGYAMRPHTHVLAKRTIGVYTKVMCFVSKLRPTQKTYKKNTYAHTHTHTHTHTHIQTHTHTHTNTRLAREATHTNVCMCKNKRDPRK